MGDANFQENSKKDFSDKCMLLKHPVICIDIGCEISELRFNKYTKKVAQWAPIAHLGASIMFRDTIIYDAQRQVTLNLKQ